MLVAQLNGQRVEASSAECGWTFACPNCAGQVILKRGRLVIPHFAHTARVSCAWARGETLAHLQAKSLLRETFDMRGLDVDVEHVVPTLPGERRADVMLWSPTGKQVAFELQHTSLDLDGIEQRTAAYMRAGIAVIWVAFLRSHVLDAAEPRAGGEAGDLFVVRYAAKSWERWAHGFNRGGLWFFDPSRRAFYRGRLRSHEIRVPDAAWRDNDGHEHVSGGYTRFSRRWRELTLWGPWDAKDLRVIWGRRAPTHLGWHRYPGGPVASLTPHQLHRSPAAQST